MLHKDTDSNGKRVPDTLERSLHTLVQERKGIHPVFPPFLALLHFKQEKKGNGQGGAGIVSVTGAESLSHPGCRCLN